MNGRRAFSVAAIVCFILVGGFSLVKGFPQDESPNKSRPTPQVSSPPPKPTEQPPQLGGPGLGGGTAQIDSTTQRMALLIAQSQALSKSFGELAKLHHGADKSEVLMMQRMSDAMGSMAGEVKASLEVYKAMLGDETASDTGTMKTEVQGLKSVLDIVAAEVSQALGTLQRLESQLGQG
jgi:hypothetical protein